MDSTVVSAVTQLLDELGSRFGATGAHLWGEMVTFTVVRAYAEIALLAFVVVVGFILVLSTARSRLVKEPKDQYHDISPTLAGVVMGLGLLLLAGSFIVLLDRGASWARTLAAPEAATIMHLIGK